LAVCETSPVKPEGLATGVNVLYAGGMLLPNAGQLPTNPRMVSNEVNVLDEHHVVPAALLMAPLIAAIVVKALY
jgi:hypothetical protein